MFVGNRWIVTLFSPKRFMNYCCWNFLFLMLVTSARVATLILLWASLHSCLANGFKEALLGGSPKWIRFLLLFLCLGCCYYCRNTIVSLFSSCVPSLATDCKKVQKLWHAVQKQIMSAWWKKHHKSPDHLFNLNCFDSMLHTIIFQAYVLSFLIWVAKVFI